MDIFINNWPIFAFFAFIVVFIFLMFSKKGKGMMFGGEIIKTLDRFIERKEGFSTTKIKVHVIKPKERSHERDVGIEITHNAKLGWSMTPIKLTAREAKELNSLISEALESNV